MTNRIPHRTLGRTHRQVSIFGLGGEGILRTHNRPAEAAAVINQALDEGVTYCDTAPAYASSQDYYGATLAERRDTLFLAAKTHDRSRDGSLRLLDDSLKRLRTNHLDLWQLHDLRTPEDLDQIFGPHGALKALTEAQAQGQVRHLGLTGHHDPAILLDAIQRFPFDTILIPLNPADIHRLSFAQTVLPEAHRQNLGIIAMKTMGGGTLIGPGRLTPTETLRYTLALPQVATAIIGCASPQEVTENAQAARLEAPMQATDRQALEARTQRHAQAFTPYKRPID